jgi:hypothetical protein
LMQDRHRQFDEIFLQRTAGPYIRVIRDGAGLVESPSMSAVPPKAEVNSEHSRLWRQLSRLYGIVVDVMALRIKVRNLRGFLRLFVGFPNRFIRLPEVAAG